MHSPELPLLTSTILSSIDVTRTFLFDNEPHSASTGPNATLSSLPCGRIYPSRTFHALSDLSHYQPVDKRANQYFRRVDNRRSGSSRMHIRRYLLQ